MEKRYGTLDAMRGVAALTVVIMHSWPLTSAACHIPTCNVPFGYLAVDMFFALSGFVLSHSYDQRFAHGMSARTFLRLRIERLFPTYWLAAAVGIIPLVWDVLRGATSFASLVVLTLFNGALLPSPTFRSHIDPFPLLSPAWSLFLELWVANLAFAIFWKLLHGRLLLLLITVSFAALMLDGWWFGSLDTGSLWHTFAGGFPRVFFSFFVGVFLRRLHEQEPTRRVPAFLILVGTAATFWVVIPTGWALAYEAFAVSVLYPALIYFGANAFERHPWLGKLLGNASYALYLIHIPILLLILRLQPRLGIRSSIGASAVFVCSSVLAALIIDFLYDRPARRLFRRTASAWFRWMRNTLALPEVAP